MRGRNAIGGSFITIKRLRHSCRIVSRRWNPFAQQSSAAAVPVYISKRYMTFTFREFSEEIPYLQLTFSEPKERYFWF
jgi:hypothetical protein